MKLIDVLASPMAALRGCCFFWVLLLHLRNYRTLTAFIVMPSCFALSFIVQSLTAFIVQFYMYQLFDLL